MLMRSSCTEFTTVATSAVDRGFVLTAHDEIAVGLRLSSWPLFEQAVRSVIELPRAEVTGSVFTAEQGPRRDAAAATPMDRLDADRRLVPNTATLETPARC